eukprot:434906-Pleurochrysis_carterae.AAC.1
MQCGGEATSAHGRSGSGAEVGRRGTAAWHCRSRDERESNGPHRAAVKTDAPSLLYSMTTWALRARKRRQGVYECSHSKHACRTGRSQSSQKGRNNRGQAIYRFNTRQPR